MRKDLVIVDYLVDDKIVTKDEFIGILFKLGKDNPNIKLNPQTDGKFEYDGHTYQERITYTSPLFDFNNKELIDKISNLPVYLEWHKTLPVGISKFEHYGSFENIIKDLKKEYQLRNPNNKPDYILSSSYIAPILCFSNNFFSNTAIPLNTAYALGSIFDLNVIIVPYMPKGKFILGNLDKCLEDDVLVGYISD